MQQQRSAFGIVALYSINYTPHKHAPVKRSTCYERPIYIYGTIYIIPISNIKTQKINEKKYNRRARETEKINLLWDHGILGFSRFSNDPSPTDHRTK